MEKLKQFSRKHIESQHGHYDNDGFYLLQDGDFYDAHGFYFNKDGFNDQGGFYDPGSGEYVDPNDTGAADYYEELCGASQDSDSGDDGVVDEYNIPEEEANKGIRREHCMPVLQWLGEQPKDKMHVVKLLNIPRQATENMLLKWLNKKIKGFKHDKLVLEQSSEKKGNNGVVWISTEDQLTVRQLIKLHYHVSNILTNFTFVRFTHRTNFGAM